jgi:hypothetical protein
MSEYTSIGARTFLAQIIRNQGKEYAPRGLILQDPVTVERWVEMVQERLLPDIRKEMTHGEKYRKRVEVTPGIILHYLDRRNKLWWYIAEKGAIVGAGRLLYYPKDGFYGEDYAALFFKELRRKGLYPKIIQTLALAVDAPVESSSNLKSAAAVRAWKHMGLFWPETNRFQHGKGPLKRKLRKNPRPRVLEWCPAFSAEDLALFLTSMAT